MIIPLLAAGVLSLVAVPAYAGSYVVCDNGLDCVTTPCPSTNAYDVKGNTLRTGIWTDIASLPASDREAIEREQALYYGKVVISGRFEQRTVESQTGSHTLPYLVAERVERKSTENEQRMCRG